MKYIIGGTHRHYMQWLRDNGVLNHRDAVHITREEQLMGLQIKKDQIVRLGWGSPAFEALLLTRML